MNSHRTISQTRFNGCHRSAYSQTCVFTGDTPHRSRSTATCGTQSAPRPRCGFTLVEVLAAVMLVSIILPAAMRGISVSTQAASAARHRNEAAALGQCKLDEIVSTQEYLTNSNMSGDFGPDWPGYQWNVQIQDWSPNGTAPTNFTGTLVEELDMHVTWTDRSRPQEKVLSTLVYDSPYAGNAQSN